jgi:hypothetical protein
MAEKVIIETSHPELLLIFDKGYSSATNRRTINIAFCNDLIDMLDWYRTHKEKLDEEAKLREKYESLSSAYEQYLTTLKLVKDTF